MFETYLTPVFKCFPTSAPSQFLVHTFFPLSPSVSYFAHLTMSSVLKSRSLLVCFIVLNPIFSLSPGKHCSPVFVSIALYGFKISAPSHHAHFHPQFQNSQKRKKKKKKQPQHLAVPNILFSLVHLYFFSHPIHFNKLFHFSFIEIHNSFTSYI